MNSNDMSHLPLPSGNYRRKNYTKDVIYTFFEYKDVHVSFSMSTGLARVTDKLVEQMHQDGFISSEQLAVYTEQAQQLLTPPARMDELTPEQIYVQMQHTRRTWLGMEALEKERELQCKRGSTFDLTNGIDQQEKKQALLEKADTVILMLCQAELLSVMKEDLNTIQKSGKKICLIVSKESGWDIADRETMQRELEGSPIGDYYEIETSTPEGLQKVLAEHLPKNLPGAELPDSRSNGLLLAYGEDSFLLCRSLPLETIVHGTPSGYFTRALTNQFGFDAACVVYVPAHFDIVSWVPLTERTRLSFRQLYRLWKKYGDTIYTYSPAQLYQIYPQQFFNVYDTEVTCTEDEAHYPISVSRAEAEDPLPLTTAAVFSRYDLLRDRAISQYLNSQKNLKYYSSYFDEYLEEQDIPWNCTSNQKGILVQGIRLSQVKDAGIINCKEGVPLRQVLRGESLRLVSNFLFFLTPPLARLYNELRKDRPREQIHFTKLHLDYMLCHKDSERIETFPLFEKACIAKKRDGQFLFFNYRLGGGKIRVNDTVITWQDTDVNVPDGIVYTPDYSRPDEAADDKTFRKAVGNDRLNLVIIQNRIHCIRKGDVILPSIGVVVSLDQASADRLLHECQLSPLENGYYDCNDLTLTVELDGPSQIPPEEWQQTEWAYGGGMSLILDGQGLDSVMPTPAGNDEQGSGLTASLTGHDADSTLAASPEEWFRKEGWMSPLSRQTQESALHKIAKHPRTAIGITWENELVILVFSGRIRLSSGADYYEMCRIARKLIPNIRCLMNVDGGGSAMLGMVLNGSFVELSCPATSGGSCVGMVRPINTILHLDP